MNYDDRYTFLAVALGSIAEIAAIVFSIASAGAGHGSYFLAKMLFPFTMMVANHVGHIPGWAIVASLFQFPLYAYWISCGLSGLKRIRTGLILCGAHLLASAFALNIKGGF